MRQQRATQEFVKQQARSMTVLTGSQPKESTHNIQSTHHRAKGVVQEHKFAARIHRAGQCNPSSIISTAIGPKTHHAPRFLAAG
jgi:hypothetical protein